jgi:hypothetical protein
LSLGVSGIGDAAIEVDFHTLTKEADATNNKIIRGHYKRRLYCNWMTFDV